MDDEEDRLVGDAIVEALAPEIELHIALLGPMFLADEFGLGGLRRGGHGDASGGDGGAGDEGAAGGVVKFCGHGVWLS